jgi:hypothetical protein
VFVLAISLPFNTDDDQIDSMSVALGRDSRGTLVARPHRPEGS